METDSNNITTSICTYNILADRYASKKTFEYCDRKFLHWKSHRRNLILSQLSKLHCDILFLQEVDHINDFENYLRGQKYFTIYYQRPNKKNDGCLIAWKTSKFELDSSVYITNYNNLCQSVEYSDSLRFNKDNIGIVIILKSITNPKLKIIAANTHLYWNPNMEDVKLLQTVSFLNSIEWVVNKHQLTNYKIIIGGDFNSKPMSKVYNFIMNGFINITNNSINNSDAKTEVINEEKDERSNENIKENNKLLRIICDRDLRQTAQWLALMEIDAAYFSDNSTKNYKTLFEIAKSENRIIVTRNTRIVSRNECPKFLLIGARETQKEAYQHVINYFGITIDFKKKQYRDNILDCLACPKCLKPLKQTKLEIIKHLLIGMSNNDKLLNGKSCKGIPLEFYQCSNDKCGHLVYHREGWLDRLHNKRQEHYNNTKNLHKQQQNSNDNNIQRGEQGKSSENKCAKYSGVAKILKDHIYRKRRPIIIGIEIINGSLKKYDRIFAVKKLNSSRRLDLGLLSEIQLDNKELPSAKTGDKICIKLDTEHSYGRQFDDEYYLVVQSRRKLNSVYRVGNHINIPIHIIPNVYPIHNNKVNNKLTHKLKLKSVYFSKYGQEPQTTNHTKGFSGCLDYLFVSMDCNIKQCDKLPQPIENVNSERVKQMTDGVKRREYLCNYLPDKWHPSDHIPIKAILTL